MGPKSQQSISGEARLGPKVLHEVTRPESILHVLHQHVQRFCPSRRTIYTGKHLSNFRLSNRLEDFEDDCEVDFLKQADQSAGANQAMWLCNGSSRPDG